MEHQFEDSEARIILRSIRIEDYEAIREMAMCCFPGMEPWKREQIESQIATFAEGQLCVELDGQIVASSCNCPASVGIGETRRLSYAYG